MISSRTVGERAINDSVRCALAPNSSRWPNDVESKQGCSSHLDAIHDFG